MAELAASIIGIVSAGTKVALVLSQLANDIGSAGKEARMVATEIRGSCAVLTTLQDILKRVQTSVYYAHCADVTNDMTDTSLEMFGEILDVLDSLRSATEMPDGKLNVRRRLQWAFQKPKIMMLRAALDAYRSNLALMLGTLDIAEKTTRILGQEITQELIEEEEQDFSRLGYLRQAQRTSIIRVEEIEKEFLESETPEDVPDEDAFTQESEVSSEIQDGEPFLPQAENYVRELRDEINLLRTSRFSFQSSNPDSIRERVSHYGNRLSQLIQRDQERISGRWSQTLRASQNFEPANFDTFEVEREVQGKSSARDADHLENFILWIRGVDEETRSHAIEKLESLFGVSNSAREMEKLLTEKNILELKVSWLERQLKEWQQKQPGTISADNYARAHLPNGKGIEINNPVSPVPLSAQNGGDVSANPEISPRDLTPEATPIFPAIPKLSNFLDIPHEARTADTLGETSLRNKRRSGLWSPGSSADGGSEGTLGSLRSPSSPQPAAGFNKNSPRAIDKLQEAEMSMEALDMNDQQETSEEIGSSKSTEKTTNVFASFRVTIDDPTYKVLPVALKKYNIIADWRNYALYLVCGDQERLMGLNEKPLIVFKQLHREGKKPMFMLKKLDKTGVSTEAIVITAQQETSQEIESPENKDVTPLGNLSTSKSSPRTQEFKSFRVSIDDSTLKVLPIALKKYSIAGDWQTYALYIVYEDQERCLGMDEKPLILFKELDKEGRKPSFMIRKHASPLEGYITQSSGTAS
jgi:hypothetical protein